MKYLFGKLSKNDNAPKRKRTQLSLSWKLQKKTKAITPKKSILKIKTQEESIRRKFKANRHSLRQSFAKSTSFKDIIQIKKKIRFGSIEVREYNLILGDNPQCSNGVALTLDWCYIIDENIPTTIDDYEYYRIPRRKIKDLAMSVDDREEILLRQGVTYDELNKAAEELEKARLLRLQTINDFNAELTGNINRKKRSLIPWKSLWYVFRVISFNKTRMKA